MSFSVLAQADSLLKGDSRIGDTVRTYLTEKAPDMALGVLGAIAILVVGLWCAKLAARLLTTILLRAKIDETLAKFLGRLGQAVLAPVVVLAALEQVGVNTTSFAAILAAAGLAIGLALQGSLANFAAGVMVIVFRPFKVGDFVVAGGATGIVEEIHIFHTLLRTPDNIQIVVPNSSITGDNISNLSAKPIRRIDLVVGCGYEDDLIAVKQLLGNLLAADKRVLSDPEPVVAVSELADHCVSFVVRPWVANADYWSVRWDLNESIKHGFDAHGFHIPYPQQDVHFHRVHEQARKTPESPATVPLTIHPPVQVDSFTAAPSDDAADPPSTTIEPKHEPTILKLVRPRRAA